MVLKRFHGSFPRPCLHPQPKPTTSPSTSSPGLFPQKMGKGKALGTRLHPLHFKLFGKTTTFILLVNNFFLDLNKSSTCRLPRTVYSLALMTSHVSDFTATIRPVSLQGQIVPEYVLPFCRHAQRYTFNFVQTNSYQYAFFTVSNRSLSTTTL